MSNEELAVSIKAGERDRLLSLWEQVKDLVAWYAVRRYNAASGLGGCEVEDLIQSGYLAMVAAIEDFDPGAGYKFTTYLAKHLKNAFAEAGGYRSEKQKRDPLQNCDSLDRPIGDKDGPTLGDVQTAQWDCIEEAERRIWREQLRAALDRAFDTLPLEWQELLDRHYYFGETMEQAAMAMGYTRNTVKEQTKKALQYLYRNSDKNGLAWFYKERGIDLKTQWYVHVGPRAYLATGTSAVEKIVLQRERDREHPDLLTEYMAAARKNMERDLEQLAQNFQR